MIIGLGTLLWGIGHMLMRGRGGVVSAAFRKVSIRRFGVGFSPKTRSRVVTPTVGQMLGMALLLVMIFCASYIGPDYLKPTTCLWGGDGCTAVGVYSGPPPTSYRLRTRDLNPNGWAPFNDPLLQSFNVDIQKSFWTSGNRLGLIAYTLLPLIVTLAMKLWPFAVYSIPFVRSRGFGRADWQLTDYGYDKTAVFHRWIGRILWALVTVHVGLWTKQLMDDIDPFGNPVFFGSFQLYRFVAGWIVRRSRIDGADRAGLRHPHDHHRLFVQPATQALLRGAPSLPADLTV